MKFLFLLVILLSTSFALIITTKESLTQPIQENTPNNIITNTPISIPSQKNPQEISNVDPVKTYDIPADRENGKYPCAKFKYVFEETAKKPVHNGKSMNDYGLDGSILGAIAVKESGCGRSLIGYSGGDFGLMQVNVVNFAKCNLNKQSATYDNAKNTECAAKILLSNLATALKYDLGADTAMRVALYGYNAGYAQSIAAAAATKIPVKEAFRKGCKAEYCSQKHRVTYPDEIMKNFPQQSFAQFQRSLNRFSTNYA